jgi:hypothetical protein
MWNFGFYGLNLMVSIISYDFDIFIKLDFSSEWKGAYYNKEFYLSFLDIESEKDLAETIEHELVHNKQFKEYGKTFTQKKLRRVQKTPYFDLNYEMPALATNVLRELPTVSDYINDKFNVFKSSNPWADFENFEVKNLYKSLNLIKPDLIMMQVRPDLVLDRFKNYEDEVLIEKRDLRYST